MTKITCACFDCKYCDDNAQCTAKEIEITFGIIVTAWEGIQDAWWCKSFEMSEEAKDMYKRIAEILKGGE